ncbi:uncharacterized protein METZ01_LOCUS370404, partial [marine metagenome]
MLMCVHESKNYYYSIFSLTNGVWLSNDKEE